jgi:SAM-dependent methyltransferase
MSLSGDKGKQVCFKYFEEIKRVLKPDGRFCIQVPKKGDKTYKHGLIKCELEIFFEREHVKQYDYWYWTITNLERNNQPHWLNQGKFRERDMELFGRTYE